MADTVIDTSVLLAFTFDEKHAVDPDEILSQAAMSAVNHAEAISLLRQRNISDAVIADTLRDFALRTLSFDQEAAEIAGMPIPKGLPLGIGLGDCAFIATGISRGAIIYTADRDWLKLDIDADIRLIR